MTKRMTLIEKVDALILREVDKFEADGLVRNKKAFWNLWDVLTALRGPDKKWNQITADGKGHGTAVIRAKLPGLSKLASMSGASTRQRDGICYQCVADVGSRHFADHILSAAEALRIPERPCRKHGKSEQTDDPGVM